MKKSKLKKSKQNLLTWLAKLLKLKYKQIMENLKIKANSNDSGNIKIVQ